MARIVRAGEFVGPGERTTAEYFERHLPDSWVVICNKELVRPASVREVDFIVVADHTIFAIEEKYWWGAIHGNENGWVLSSGESYNSPLRQVDQVTKRLAGFLKDNIPDLKQALAHPFVFPRVVLSHREVQLFVDDPRVHTQVLALEGSEEDLGRFDRQQEGVVSIAAHKQAIIERLTALPSRPEIPKRVGDYEVLEVLPTSGNVRCLRARHEDGSERLLKLIERPVTEDQSRLEEARRALLREYDALKQLALTGRVPIVDPYFSWDQEQFWVFPVHPVSGRTLRADLTDALPDEKRILPVAIDAFNALQEVHSSGVVHRSLTPDRIHLKEDGSVTFSDFLVARIEGQRTIAESASALDVENAYRAPECAGDIGPADNASDTYSLAASLLYWISGFEPEGPGQAFRKIDLVRPGLDAQLSKPLDELFSQCLAEDITVRPAPDEALARLAAVAPGTSTVKTSAISLGAEPSSGDVIDGQYRVVRRLGEGATAVTYLAEDLYAERLFVLKIIRNPELVARLARAEFKFLADLHHPSLPRVFDIRPPAAAFHLKLEYVQGSPLRDVAHQFRGDTRACLRIGLELLAALEYLGKYGRIHRDISPSNILVPDEETLPVKLIDFGLATWEGGRSTAVGTPLYRAPEIDRGNPWTTACDLYSLGVVLVETLIGRLPYEVEDGVARKERLAEFSAERSEIGPRLVAALLKSVAPDPGDRFESAADFADALRNATVEEAEEADGARTINPTVDALRATYRNSRLGNSENRGLDTDFARQTYIPTRLDTELLPRIIAGGFRFVVLSGNPGDGKTAFLQRLRDELLERGASVEQEDAAGWCLQLGERRYAALYDASESHEGEGADALLHSILAPLSGQDPDTSLYTAAIAANDGRLLDFFERCGALRYPWLWEQVRNQLFGDGESDDSVLVVDLKRRSLVGDDINERSLASGILNEFVSRARWEACETCLARLECPIRLNALSFSDTTVGPRVWKQLHRLLLAVHLRRERRPTLRDLRSALAFLVTHDLGCEDVHAEREGGLAPLREPTRFYFAAAFDGSGSPDLLLDEWRQLDPATVPAPRLDRFLYFHRGAGEAPLVRELMLSPTERPPLPTATPHLGAPDWIAFIKRRYAFEGAPETRHEGWGDLTLPEKLLPYRHLGEFLSAIHGAIHDPLIVGQVLMGISRADGIPEGACRDGLALRATPDKSEGDLVVVKRYPAAEFRFDPPAAQRSFADGVSDQLILSHVSGSPILHIGLDLFEFLGRAREGFLAGAEEQKALLEDLSNFKNQLLSRPTQEVIVVEAGLRMHSVKVEEGRIIREGVQN